MPEIRVYSLKSVNTKNPQGTTGLQPDVTSADFSRINVSDLVGQIKDGVVIFSNDVYAHFKQTRPEKTEFGLAGMDSLGGLAMPSFSVTKDTIGGNEFGEISLLVHPRSIDPKKSRNNAVYTTSQR